MQPSLMKLITFCLMFAMNDDILMIRSKCRLVLLNFEFRLMEEKSFYFKYSNAMIHVKCEMQNGK